MRFPAKDFGRNKRLMDAMKLSNRFLILENVCKEEEIDVKTLIMDTKEEDGYMPEVSLRYHPREITCSNIKCKVDDDGLPDLD